jgi:hypothetical protein
MVGARSEELGLSTDFYNEFNGQNGLDETDCYSGEFMVFPCYVA